MVIFNYVKLRKIKQMELTAAGSHSAVFHCT